MDMLVGIWNNNYWPTFEEVFTYTNLHRYLLQYYIRVHIAAQPANRYVVAFHIAISYHIYSHTRRRLSMDADSGCTSIY